MPDTADLAERVQKFRRDGFVVIRDAVEPELVAALKAALARLETEQGFGYRDTAFEGTRTVRVYNLLIHDPIFARVPIQPKVLELAEAVLDPGLLLSSLSAITLGPDQAAQPIHADSQLIPLPRPHPTIAVNAMWALSDFTAANGATRVIPGSHLRNHAPDYHGSYETMAAEMPAGSVMLFDSQLWHGGGANTTQERRWAIACYYCAGWIRQQENQQLGVPLELARGFPRRLQELMGYSVYQGLYGHIDNRDPIELLGQERRGQMVWQASDKKR
jgi:ectoine hydroxylase-related dioxygenase (phytanoyl-CoA dioxygenase family)